MTFHEHNLAIIAAMVACTFPAGVAVAQNMAPRVAPSAPSRPLAADVAGVRLRASPAEVRTALAKAGYRINNDLASSSFDQDVQAEAARRRGQHPTFPKQAGTGKIMAIGPHQEYLEVEFMQTAAGSEVSSVYAKAQGTAISAADFRRQLRAKYGEPDDVRFQGAEMSWCSPETMRNCGAGYAASGPLDNQYPSIKATAYEGDNDRRVTLHVGETAFAALAVAKEEAVRRLAPPASRASF